MMYIKIIWVLILSCACSFMAKAQIIVSPTIDSLVIKTIARNQENPTIPGFRIQVYNANSQVEAEKIKEWLMQFDPTLQLYIMYQAPNFKVRVGNFRKRVDAQYLLNALHEKFPSAFLVPDRISFRNESE